VLEVVNSGSFSRHGRAPLPVDRPGSGLRFVFVVKVQGTGFGVEGLGRPRRLLPREV